MAFLNFLAGYFGQHRDKKLIYFFGELAEYCNFKTTIETNKFDSVKVLFESEKAKVRFDKVQEKNPFVEECLKFISVDELKNEDLSDVAFCFDHFKKEEGVIKYFSLHPKTVYGHFTGDIETFKLWENLRDFADKIVLATDINSMRCDVLDWNKNDKFDNELSVIFPVYNVEKYLKQCLDSVTAWKAPYVEYVFVDDGSPDNSVSVIEKYAKKDKRVKLLRKKNGGCASARQYGLEHTNSRYVGFVDPDDFVDPTMFKKLLTKALTGTYDICYCGYNEFYESTQTFKPVEDVTGAPYIFGTSDIKLIDDLIAYQRIAIWRGIYSRRFLKENDINFHIELKRFDDLPFKVETLARAKYVASVNENLYFYRMGRPGQDVSIHDERLYIHFDIFKILDEFFKKYRSSRQLDHYYQVKVQTHFWAFTKLDESYFKEYLGKASADLGIKNTKELWQKTFSRYYTKKETEEMINKLFK